MQDIEDRAKLEEEKKSIWFEAKQDAHDID